MVVEITCPECNFSKRIRKDKIPEKARWATCPKCKNRFEFAAPAPVSFAGSEGEEPRSDEIKGRTRPPWENRSELGLWKSIYGTTKAVLFSPENLFCNMVFQGGVREPLAFGLLLGSIGTMFGIFWQFLIASGSLMALWQGTFGQFTMPLIFLGIIIISPLFVVISMILMSGVLHLMLRIVGGAKNGFEATFRVISYSQATQVLGLIPFIGGIIGFLWILIVQFIGLREIHETSYLRVIVAYLIPPALIFFLVMAVVLSLLVLGYL